MLTAILVSAVLSPGGISLEAKLSRPDFTRGERIRIEIFAINHSDQEIVIGKSALGHDAGGRMEAKVDLLGTTKVELNHYNPNLGQIMIGQDIVISPEEFSVIPAKGRALVFFEQIDGEWKDGYTPWNAPRGIQALSVPARAGTYKFSYTYSFNRRQIEEQMKKASFEPGYRLDEHVIPDRHRKIVFQDRARTLFDSALEGKWAVSGEFKIVNR